MNPTVRHFLVATATSAVLSFVALKVLGSRYSVRDNGTAIQMVDTWNEVHYFCPRGWTVWQKKAQ
jgi:hypothetical protein